GDELVVLEQYDPSRGITEGGALDAVPFPRPSYIWTASSSVRGAYYVRTAAGRNPNLSAANLQQVFYSPSAGSESILSPASGVLSLAAGQWAYGDGDG